MLFEHKCPITGITWYVYAVSQRHLPENRKKQFNEARRALPLVISGDIDECPY